MHLTTYLIHALPIDQRRVFAHAEAASYVGISKGHFRKLVKMGTMPRPLPEYGRAKRWDKLAIDQAMNKMSGLTDSGTDAHNAYNAWKEGL